MTLDKWDQLNACPYWPDDLAEDWKKTRQLEHELHQDGVKPFPINQPGLDAYNLWQLIRKRLLKGKYLELSVTELNLPWHRQRLKRARELLLNMQLIRRAANGHFVLGKYSPFDEVAREELLTIHLVRELFLSLGTLKSKIQ